MKPIADPAAPQPLATTKHSRRQPASADPLAAPCVDTAANPYAEQLG